MNIGFGLAFRAGVLSFFSLCVLALIPGYLATIAGLSFQKISESGRGVARRAGLAAVFFILGFAVAFAALGALASSVTSPLTPRLPTLKIASSILIIAYGLGLTGIPSIPLPYKRSLILLSRFAGGSAGAFAMGLAFAFGWVPCIGPVLADILGLAAGESVARGTALLFTYSLGLGLPFIAAGLATSAFISLFVRDRRFSRAGEIVAGALLISIGAFHHS